MPNKAIFKVIVVGDAAVGKTTFLERFAKLKFESGTKMTIGIEFYERVIKIDNKVITLQLWYFGAEERFKYLQLSYVLGAKGAILLYDITRPSTLDYISEWITIIRANAGNIPIMLVGNKADLLDSRQLSLEDGINFANSKGLQGYVECSAKTGENVEDVFIKPIKMICSEFFFLKEERISEALSKIKEERISEALSKPKEDLEVSKLYEINEFLTLKLENGKTNLYVKGRLFIQCKRLVLNITKQDIPTYDEIDSIDEAADHYKHTLWQNRIVEGPGARPSNIQNETITPEQEFWGHCSNIQTWVEYNYDTRLIHSNLAFPLLKALVDAGDPNAKNVFKREVVERFESGHPNVIKSIILAKLLDYFSPEERKSLIQQANIQKIVAEDSDSFFDFYNRGILEYLLPKEKRQLIQKYYPIIFKKLQELKKAEIKEPFKNLLYGFQIRKIFENGVVDLISSEAKKRFIQENFSGVMDYIKSDSTFSRFYEIPSRREKLLVRCLMVIDAIKGTKFLDKFFNKFVSHYRYESLNFMLNVINSIRASDEDWEYICEKWVDIWKTWLKKERRKEKKKREWIEKNELIETKQQIILIPKHRKKRPAILVCKCSKRLPNDSLSILLEKGQLDCPYCGRSIRLKSIIIGCVKCHNILPEKSKRAYLEKGGIYCPNCGVLNTIKRILHVS